MPAKIHAPRPPRAAAEQRTWVRASELGEYSYCERAWWLRRVCGHRPDEHGRSRLARGRRAHIHHARAVARGGADRRLGWMLVALALLLMLAALAA